VGSGANRAAHPTDLLLGRGWRLCGFQGLLLLAPLGQLARGAKLLLFAVRGILGGRHARIDTTKGAQISSGGQHAAGRAGTHVGLRSCRRHQLQQGALGRTANHVDLALAQLELLKARYDRAVRLGASFPERSELAAAYNAQRSVAQARLRDLAIHREAIGFRRNQILHELYPIPQKLTPQADG
jgi:hypothetical protein